MKAKILGVATTLTFLVVVSPAYAASYNFTTLDYPLATNGTYAYGINDASQIVGNTGGNGHGTPSGFLYSGGTYTTLNDPLGTFGTSVQSINNAGQIVGWYQDGINGNTARGFVYNGGTYTTLNGPLGSI